MSTEAAVAPEATPLAPAPDPGYDRAGLVKSFWFLGAHVLAAGAAVWVGFRWEWLAVAIGAYLLRMFFITGGYHRYFAHRAYMTSRWFQFVLALGGCMAAQKGPLWWAGHHRDHHRYSDTPQDVHSPVQRGFLWSHMGWILSSRYAEIPFDNIRDYARFPELRWLDRHYLIPPLAGMVVLYLIGGAGVAVWGGLVSTVLLWHGTFTINSLSHVFGSRRFPTKDESRNNGLLALITLGEGWHNNHHHYAAAANQGFYWYEIDVSFMILRVLALLGIVWDLRTPPRVVLEAGRRHDAARRAGETVSLEPPPAEAVA